MNSGNPLLRAERFSDAIRRTADNTMTINGTVNKVALMLLTCVFTAATGAFLIMKGYSSGLIMGVGLIGGLATAIYTVFKPAHARVSGMLYVVFQGLLLGAVSLYFQQAYDGIVLQAVGLTFFTLFSMLMMYKMQLIRATQGFRTGVMAATGAIALVYLSSFVLGFFNIQIPYLHSGGTWGIVISLVIVTVAALNLIIDFDNIERGVAAGAPKYMEWFAAFGLMVTLIWLYLEFLRLLARSRR